MDPTIIASYLADPSLENVKKIAAANGMSHRSLIGKLSRLNIYQKQTYVSKLGTPPVTKLELLAQIEASLGIQLPGLEKASKEALRKLANELNDE